MATVLCVISTSEVQVKLEYALRKNSHRVLLSETVSQAQGLLDDTDGVELCIASLGEGLASELLAFLASRERPIPLLLVDPNSGIEEPLRSVEMEAGECTVVPLVPVRVDMGIQHLLTSPPTSKPSQKPGRAPMRNTAPVAVSEIAPRTGVIGRSLALQRVLETVEQIAPTNSTVLFQGESGTGKEVLGRLVHDLSPRRDQAYIAVNCAALPEGLVESTLFGHEKGAFTGAAQQVRGAFERAHGGTLLLDEISEMPLALQAKLLRALQEMQFERLGGTEPVKVDVRVIATTNRDLASAVDDGLFREDLYYRLSVIPILVPALRERREDIPLLLDHFVRSCAEAMGKSIRRWSPRTLEMLMGHDWPGNVRELQNVVERAVALCRTDELMPDDFIPEKRGIAPWRRPRVSRDAGNVVAELVSYRLDEAEAVLIEKALEATRGNRTQAADLLGISVRTLRNKLNRPEEDESS